MKRNILTMLLLSVCLWATAQNFDTSHSYVSERIYLNEEGTKYIDNVTYLDGFGRKLQEVQVKGSPDGTSDLVQPYSYGKMGRTERTFLPYAKANNNGAFVANPLNAAHWNAYGTADAAYAFTKTEYDNSPLNRIIRQTGPGAAWHTAGKAVTTSHDMNDTNEVRLYRVNKTSGLVYQDGHYRRGSLDKVTTTDEDGHTTETFTDNQGKTILTVVVNGEERLETYYVYDNRELLRWVLSPEASHRIASSIDTEALYKYAYYYEYDWLKRMTFKKLPGCEPVYMVYDKRDRLVLTQDGNMRALDSNRWNYTEYNTKNRPVESGEIVLSSGATHAQLIDSMMDSESVPSGTRTPLQYIRYDKYTANEHVTPHAFTPVSGYAEDYHRKTVGRMTATKTRVLGTNQWITSTIYYDSKCRPMQEITDNLVGGVSRVTHSYDFVGNVVKSQEAHGTNTLEYAYTYDDRSRLLNVTASFNGATPVTMKTLEYDEVGRLKKVNLHNNGTSIGYDYNIRSWLTGITGSKFSQSLSYGNGNGNIRSMSWSADGSSHNYAFTYDGANRLLDAIHGTSAYTEKVASYDKNGNILGLQRYGNGLIDDLTYSYNGNQLTQVEDATGNSAGFNNGASTANEYTYDYNGNLTKDSNKGISNISWNSLNLPNVVTFEDGSTITYSYAADGTKLRTVHSINGATAQKDYCGSVIYENGAAKLWQTEAGYISMNDSKYHYYLQDHQGNNRVVVSETGATEEVNHYYAFGGLFGNSNSVQPFKYNGKELDTKKDLNWYDYGARQYDAALGRWFAVDPLAEKMSVWSPYAYCFDNPIRLVDSDGTIPTLYEAALIAKHVYGDNVELTGGWKVSNKRYDNMSSRFGLKSAIYERTVNGITEYVYATAGTELFTDYKDCWEDFTQLFGVTSQYDISINIADKLSKDLGNLELTFVGHSLGGGLAAANALYTDKNAITFNPAALSSATKRNLGLKPLNKGNITNVIISGELINNWQSIANMSYEGEVYMLNAFYLPMKNNIINRILRIKNHLIGTVINKLKKEQSE